MRENFAKLCEELNLQESFESTMVIQGVEYKIEYEGINFLFFLCGKYGHRREECGSGSSYLPSYGSSPTRILAPPT